MRITSLIPSQRTLAVAALGFVIGLGTLLSCSGKRCGPENCATCCSADGACVAEISRLACGSSGSVCQACGTNSACVSGACVPSDQNGSPCQQQGKCTRSDGTCGDVCNNGCCLPNDPAGTCQADGLAQSACGSRARTCSACGADQLCTPVLDGGACVVAQSDVFKPCTQDSECSALGSQGICKKTTSSGNALYAGGYCTTLCGAAGLPLCPGDSVCVGGADSYGESDAFCWKACETDLDCRGGSNYSCYWNGNINLGCWINPSAAPAGVPGSACTDDSQCGPPPDFRFCFPEHLEDGGSTGFAGGSCMSDCSFAGDPQCGPTGLCIPFSAGTSSLYLCQAACTGPGKGQGDPTDGGCRDGYVCRGFIGADGGLDPTGYCARACDAPLGDGTTTLGCRSGYSCQPNGYCCTADGGCI